jgi:hypothetical protein
LLHKCLARSPLLGEEEMSLKSLSLAMKPDGSQEWRFSYADASCDEARWAIAKAMQIGATVIFDGDLSGVVQTLAHERGVALPQWAADVLEKNA